MDPTALALLNAGSQVLGAAASRPDAPTVSGAHPLVNSWFDGSGWTVATSGASAQGGARTQSGAPTSFSPWMLAAGLLAVVAWKNF